MSQGGEIKRFQIFARIDTSWKKLTFSLQENLKLVVSD